MPKRKSKKHKRMKRARVKGKKQQDKKSTFDLSKHTFLPGLISSDEEVQEDVYQMSSCKKRERVSYDNVAYLLFMEWPYTINTSDLYQKYFHVFLQPMELSEQQIENNNKKWIVKRVNTELMNRNNNLHYWELADIIGYINHYSLAKQYSCLQDKIRNRMNELHPYGLQFDELPDFFQDWIGIQQHEINKNVLSDIKKNVLTEFKHKNHGKLIQLKGCIYDNNNKQINQQWKIYSLSIKKMLLCILTRTENKMNIEHLQNEYKNYFDIELDMNSWINQHVLGQLIEPDTYKKEQLLIMHHNPCSWSNWWAHNGPRNKQLKQNVINEKLSKTDENEFACSSKIISELKKKNENGVKLLNEAETLCYDLKTKSEGLIKKVQSQNSQIDTMNAQYTQLENLLEKNKLKTERLKQKSEKQKTEIHSLESKNHIMEQKYNNLNTKCRQLKSKCNEFKNKAQQLNITLESEKININKLNTEITETKRKYNNVITEKKVLQVKMDELHSTHDELERKYNQLNEKFSYLSWNATEIADWILNINKIKYKKYYNDLVKNMIDECIDGQCLNDLTTNDLHRFGIKYFKDKCDILTAIHQLMRNNNMVKRNSVSNSEQKDVVCIICYDHTPTYACVPCGHKNVCENCQNSLTGICPICRHKYDCLVKIFE